MARNHLRALMLLTGLMATLPTAAVPLDSLLERMEVGPEVRAARAEQRALADERRDRADERGWSLFGGATAGRFQELEPNAGRVDYTGYGAQLGLRYEKGKVVWANQLNLAYGVTRLGRDGDWQKNEDKIDYQSRFSYRLKNKLNAASQASLRSQFAPGFENPGDSLASSYFFAPAYLQLSLGLEWQPKPWFSLYLAPVNGKFTFVLDQRLANAGAFGVREARVDSNGTITREGKQVRAEFGAGLTAQFQKEVVKNVEVVSRLDLFNNYLDPNTINRRYIDVNWETTLNLKINKYLSASVFVHLLYDRDIPFPTYGIVNGERQQTGTEARLQIKQTLGVGLSYRLGELPMTE